MSATAADLVRAMRRTAEGVAEIGRCMSAMIDKDPSADLSPSTDQIRSEVSGILILLDDIDGKR